MDVHTNAVESLWSMFKRGFAGAYHKMSFKKMSFKHLYRYVDELAGRKNRRDVDTVEQRADLFAGVIRKRLKCNDLIAPNGLPSGLRSGW